MARAVGNARVGEFMEAGADAAEAGPEDPQVDPPGSPASDAPDEDGARDSDWRNVDARLKSLPDAQLHRALREAGVRAVLPSSRKGQRAPAAPDKPPQGRGEATQRWVSGDWQVPLHKEQLPEDSHRLLRPLEQAQVPPSPEVLSERRRRRTKLPWLGAGVGALIAVLAVVIGLAPDSVAPIDAAQEGSGQALPPPRAVRIADSEEATTKQGTEETASHVDGATVRSEAALPEAQGTPSPSAVQGDEAALRARIRRSRRDTEAMAALSRHLLFEDRNPEAVRWARSAVRRRPKRTRYRILLGDALAAAGRRGASIRAYRRGIARAPRNATLRSRLRATLAKR